MPPRPVAAAQVAPAQPESCGIVPGGEGGSGLGLAILGGAFLGVSAAKVGSLKKKCGGSTDCSNLEDDVALAGKKSENAARTFESLGWASMGIGVAALAAGTALFVIDKRRNQEVAARTFRLLPAAPHADAGFSVLGQF